MPAAKTQEPKPVKRLSIDCKATVNIGPYSRGGKTRGDNQAADHDMGCDEKYVPFGIVDEDTGALVIVFGRSFKTSDFIVDGLREWWGSLADDERAAIGHIQFKVDNGPESSSARTQFLKRIAQNSHHVAHAFAMAVRRGNRHRIQAALHQGADMVQMLYYPPYHSKYNPIERCWGILEQHWNGALLDTANTMVRWAQSMTWKGIKPIVILSETVYEKGVSLSKQPMKSIEARLLRNPLLPKWDVLIRPA